jgi:predicted DNA repair protein MutK
MATVAVVLVETLALSICLTADRTLGRELVHAQPLLLDSLCVFGATSMLLEGRLRGKVVVAIVASVSALGQGTLSNPLVGLPLGIRVP